MRIQISSLAAALVAAQGGELWVWAARPRLCCSATAWMKAATVRPEGISGFEVTGVPWPADTDQPGLRVHIRPAGGQLPDVLEIDITGRRSPHVAAYWDGCIMAMV